MFRDRNTIYRQRSDYFNDNTPLLICLNTLPFNKLPFPLNPPMNPGLQVHVKVLYLFLGTQVPPWWHGKDKHGFCNETDHYWACLDHSKETLSCVDGCCYFVKFFAQLNSEHPKKKRQLAQGIAQCNRVISVIFPLLLAFEFKFIVTAMLYHIFSSITPTSI